MLAHTYTRARHKCMGNYRKNNILPLKVITFISDYNVNVERIAIFTFMCMSKILHAIIACCVSCKTYNRSAIICFVLAMLAIANIVCVCCVCAIKGIKRENVKRFEALHEKALKTFIRARCKGFLCE